MPNKLGYDYATNTLDFRSVAQQPQESCALRRMTAVIPLHSCYIVPFECPYLLGGIHFQDGTEGGQDLVPVVLDVIRLSQQEGVPQEPRGGQLSRGWWRLDKPVCAYVRCTQSVHIFICRERGGREVRPSEYNMMPSKIFSLSFAHYFCTLNGLLLGVFSFWSDICAFLPF